MSTDSSAANAPSEREIEEDVMNVPLIAWLGAVSTVIIAVSVLLLMGIYHLTHKRQVAERQAEADQRITDLEAQRAIDEMMVNGYYKEPDTVVVDENGVESPKRGLYMLPVERGMRQVIESAK